MQEPSKASLSTGRDVRPADRHPDRTAQAQPQVDPPSTVGFDFYGFRVRVESDSDEALRRVGEDFRYFRGDFGSGEETFLAIDLQERRPDYGHLPALTASIYTPRNICFTEGDITYIDYFGRALAVYDRARNHVRVTSDNLSLLQEIAYLTILSRVGNALDRKGLHRLHALAVGYEGRAALFLMPSGCGKSTLGLGLMQAEADLDLVSDDSPLITRSGRVLPFPLRIGVLGAPPAGVPERFVQYMERMEFAPKYLVSMGAFEGALARGELHPELVFLAERVLGAGCSIRRTSFLSGFAACIRHMIIGVGIYQGLEFLLRTSIFDLVKSVPAFVSRSISAVSLLRRARVYTLHLGRDPRLNVRTILDFLGRELQGLRSPGDRTEAGA